MKKILFGVTIPLTANAFLADQFTSLKTADFDVHLASDPADDAQNDHVWKPIPGVVFHPLRMKREPSPARDLKSLWEWWRLVGELRPSIIVASTPKAGLLAGISGWLRRVPIRVYHVRGLRFEGLSGWRRRFSFAAEKLAITLATSVVCDSTSLRDELESHGILKPSVGVVLGQGSCCGVDTQHFRPPTPEERTLARESFGLSSDDFALLFLGRITIDKGIGELVSAASGLHQTLPHLVALLVGSVEGDLLSQGVVLPPNTKHFEFMADTRKALWAADAYCLPSYREGFPVSVLEAQSCGLATITTTATGCRDAVLDGGTGLLIPPRDASALEAAILRLVSDPRDRDEFGRQARVRAQADFEQEFVTTNWTNFLNQLNRIS